LSGQGVSKGDQVGLIGENSPEWGMSYFAVLKTGAACIPIEKESDTDKIVTLLRLGRARGIIMSDELREDHPDLPDKLTAARLNVRLLTFKEIFELGDESLEQQRISRLPSSVAPSTIASVIFTSGTTGNPKGVMLTHRNFTSLVAKLLTVYDLDKDDGLLSVLPLHHSFEFTTGFLLPLSRGAQITYLTELSAETLNRALKKGQVTCIVGVPALWDSLKRRILNRFSERSARLEDIVTALIDANYLLRDETPFNFGPLLFLPIHLAFGGKIRYLISGGSALSESTLKTMRGLGFNLNEGYGLTEAAPVLTVTRPDGRVVPGSVGQPLPGIEVRIDNPDRRGVGEVIARGPNVMAGYFGNEKATEATLRDGWLYTGDLGRLDDEGNLFIVGRLKEVIVDSNGKNVYPDELEEIYEAPDLIKEIAVVGLPDDRGERVACLVVPNYEENEGVEHEEVRAKVEEHFRHVSASLPLYKRVKTLEFTDDELPRTVTRKVKRREVVETLQQRRRRAEMEEVHIAEGVDTSWLLDAVATICEKPRAAVHQDSRFDELGFDSLMYTELATVIEAAGGEPPLPDILMGLANVSELTDHLKRKPVGAGRKERFSESREKKEDTIVVPPLVAELGRKGLTKAQKWFYHDVLEPEFKGRGYIPQHTHFIAVANHASHLDMGLVKMALGKAGNNLVALAAADYFFDNKLKRTFFENFTNLVPMERRGSLRKSLDSAFNLLERGYNVLVFPEGTRSRSGKMQRFQRGLGHLALRARVGVLPLHLSTYDALPPGSWYLKSKRVSAKIGPFLSAEVLERVSRDQPRSEAERAVTALVQRIVEALRDGEDVRIDQEIDSLTRSRSAQEEVKSGALSPLGKG